MEISLGWSAHRYPCACGLFFLDSFVCVTNINSFLIGHYFVDIANLDANYLLIYCPNDLGPLMEIIGHRVGSDFASWPRSKIGP
jgi:hypothetical protein